MVNKRKYVLRSKVKYKLSNSLSKLNFLKLWIIFVYEQMPTDGSRLFLKEKLNTPKSYPWILFIYKQMLTNQWVKDHLQRKLTIKHARIILKKFYFPNVILAIINF